MFCNNCGYNLKDDAQFCTNCGKLLSPKTPQQSFERPPAAVQQTAYVPAASLPDSKPKKKKTALIIVLCLCALLVAGLAFGTFFALNNLGIFSSGKTSDTGNKDKPSADAVMEDGILTYDGVAIDFGKNEDPKNVESTLTAADLEGLEDPDGLASTLYDLQLDSTYTKPITISIPFSDDLAELDEEAKPMLGIGTVIAFEDGSQETVYRYVEADVDDGIATAVFTPSELMGEKYVKGASQSGSSGSKTAPSGERTRAGIFWCSTTFKDGGHFLVYFPAQAHKFFIDYNDREAILNDLEAVYEQYLSRGYLYSLRTAWPIEVTIRSMTDDEAAYVYGYDGAGGTIDINRKHFEGGYKPTDVKPLLAHEFFHFVQLNYISWDTGSPWFDEASATYYESVERGSVPAIVAQYKEQIFDGAIPENDTTSNGYARMPLIAFLANRISEDFIHAAYVSAGSGVAWRDAIVSSTGEPSLWAGDFYSALVRGEVGDYTPYSLHSSLSKGSLAEAGTSLALTVPSQDEIDVMIENDEAPNLGSVTVSVAAGGAQLVALNIDADNLKLLPDGMDPVVKVSSGADARVFSIKSRDVVEYKMTESGVPLPDFKKASGEKVVFLVLVTGLQQSGKQDYTVTVEMSLYPTLDELVGTYPDGTMTFTTVFISDSLRAQIEAPPPEAGSEGSLDDLGCDISLLPILESLAGQVNPMVLRIDKTDEDTGNLTLVSTEEDSDSVETDAAPMIFVYNPGTGQLSFDSVSEGQIANGIIYAAYGSAKTMITLNGTLRMTFETIPESDLYIDILITGSKPLVVQ